MVSRKKMKPSFIVLYLGCLLLPPLTFGGAPKSSPFDAATPAVLDQAVETDLDYLTDLYKYFHRNPELHDQESKTGARIASEMRTAGLDVHEPIGGYGRVGVLKNGEGPVLLLRTVMDALPIEEETGLPYASTTTALGADGKEVPVSHVCGHDAMMVSSIGAIRYLAANKNKWQGTVILVAQPADESLLGARTMIRDGLVNAIAKPDYVIGYHLLPTFASNQIAWVSGYVTTGAETAEITVRGIPGHGSFPADAKDPIPLAAHIILAYQTMLTREIPPLDTASLNVGYIHAGQEVNAIPAEVKMGVTMRFYSNSVRDKLVAGIRRIAENQARAYGIPENRLPIVKLLPTGIGSAYNDHALTAKVVAGFKRVIDPENIVETIKLLGADETSAFANAWDTPLPMMFYFYGSTDPDALEAAEKGGPAIPSLHTPGFAPDLRPTLTTGAKSLVGAVLGVLGNTNSEEL